MDWLVWCILLLLVYCFFFFQAEDGIRDDLVTGVQTCALPISFSTKKFLSAPNQILRMMAERRTRVNRDYAIATMIYSRGKPWKSTISSWLVPAQGASVPRFKRRSLASAPRSSKSWK